MKHFKFLLFILISMFLTQCSSSNERSGVDENGELAWMTMDEALKYDNPEGKLFFVDVYTDWCGWCKRMDRTTFKDKEVIEYMAEYFHPVKFNAEQREPINYNGKEYVFVKGGRRGVNTYARELLKNRLSYPSFVYLNDDKSHNRISPGYKDSAKMLAELQQIVSATQAQ